MGNRKVQVAPKEQLGDFQQLVLLAVLRLGERAYAVPIREEIERQTGRSVSRGAVYLTLDRMEEKGYLQSWMGEPTAERGGKAKRFYQVQRSGVALLRQSRQSLLQMWQGLDHFLGNA